MVLLLLAILSLFCTFISLLLPINIWFIIIITMVIIITFINTLFSRCRAVAATTKSFWCIIPVVAFIKIDTMEQGCLPDLAPLSLQLFTLLRKGQVGKLETRGDGDGATAERIKCWNKFLFFIWWSDVKAIIKIIKECEKSMRALSLVEQPKSLYFPWCQWSIWQS